MSNNPRSPQAADPKDQANAGLDPDELRAEQADDLPDRDAMSIVGIGGLEGGMPPAGILDGVLDANLPVERYPVDQLPIQIMPPDIQPPLIQPPVLEPPGDTLPVGPPVDGDPLPPADNDPLDGIDPMDASTDASVEI
jgi:hypothetical protein